MAMQQANPTNLIAPDIAAQQLALQRQQQMADLLRQQAVTPIETNQQVSGRAVPISPMQGISKLLQAYLGGKTQDNIDKQNLDISKQYQSRLADILSPNQTTLPPDQIGVSASTDDLNKQAQIAAALRGAGGASSPNAPLDGQPITQSVSLPFTNDPSQQNAVAQPKTQIMPQIGMPQVGAQQLSQNNKFALANLLRGQVIDQIGGDKAVAAYYKDQELPESVKVNNYYKIPDANVTDAMLRELGEKGQKVVAPGNTVMRTDANGNVKPIYSAADIEKGQITFDQNGNPSVRQLPGAAAAIKTAAAAKKAGENEQTLTPVDMSVTLPNGKAIPSTVAKTISGGASSAIAPDAGGLPQNYIDAIISTESGGNPNAISPKGAQGTMQVMPKTATNPGFGVTPAKNNSPQELERVGKEYLAALNGKYNDPTISAIAYNMGTGKTDQWLQSGGDFSKLPTETKNYVASVMTKAAVNARTQPQSSAQGVGAAFGQKTFAEDQAKNAATAVSALNERVRNGEDLMQRLGESRDALQKFQAGGGKETRLQVAQMAQAIGLPDTVVNKIAGGDIAAMQEFQKIATSQAMETLKQTMATDNGQAGRMTQSEFTQFLKVNPNLSTDPRAIEKLFAFSEKLHNRNYAEQQALDQYLTNNGNPTKWPAEWARQLNAQKAATQQAAQRPAGGGMPSMDAIEAEIARRRGGK